MVVERKPKAGNSFIKIDSKKKKGREREYSVNCTKMRETHIP